MKKLLKFLLIIILININAVVIRAHIPINPQYYGFGLMPYDQNNIEVLNKKVIFDLREDDLSRYEVNERYKFKVNENQTIRVALPVIDPYGKVELYYNDKLINPQIYFGNAIPLSYDFKDEKIKNNINIDEEINNVYSQDYRFDNNLKGYYYTISNSDTVSFFLNKQKIIHEVHDQVKVVDNILTLTKNANEKIAFFVIGEDIIPEVEDDGKIDREIISYNEYFEKAFSNTEYKIKNYGLLAVRLFLFLESNHQYVNFLIF